MQIHEKLTLYKILKNVVLVGLIMIRNKLKSF